MTKRKEGESVARRVSMAAMLATILDMLQKTEPFANSASMSERTFPSPLSGNQRRGIRLQMSQSQKKQPG